MLVRIKICLTFKFFFVPLVTIIKQVPKKIDISEELKKLSSISFHLPYSRKVESA